MVVRNYLGLLTAIVPAIVLVASHSAYAADGVITGQVRNATTKAPIPDVVITVTSPVLQGEQIVVTDAGGNFRIPQLPPGEGYAVAANGGAEYKRSSRNGIKLTSGSTVRVNIELLPLCMHNAYLWPALVKYVPMTSPMTPTPITRFRIGSQVVPSGLGGLFPGLLSRAGQTMMLAATLYEKMAYVSCLSLGRIGSPIAPAPPIPIFI
jgi:Carboxypeptidase regulatory-like domain